MTQEILKEPSLNPGCERDVSILFPELIKNSKDFSKHLVPGGVDTRRPAHSQGTGFQRFIYGVQVVQEGHPGPCSLLQEPIKASSWKPQTHVSREKST